mmetsp:Transcript_39520/g.84333  ORF Transcript_39520/g.84333 Transcript_39520/m.84333 type:complete len:127 (+) Transcript_39520:827-1207(+)
MLLMALGLVLSFLITCEDRDLACCKVGGIEEAAVEERPTWLAACAGNNDGPVWWLRELLWPGWLLSGIAAAVGDTLERVDDEECTECTFTPSTTPPPATGGGRTWGNCPEAAGTAAAFLSKLLEVD